MRIIQHQDSLALHVPVQSESARQTLSGRTTGTGNLFASLVANTPTAPVSASGASGTALSEAALLDPLVGWVTCNLPAASSPSTAADTSASAAEVASASPRTSRVTTPPAPATASTSDSATTATPAQPGIGALITAIMNGSFQPTYSSPGYASNQTAQQLATLLGGTVVQQVPFASSNATTTEIKANFIQLPSGQTVNAADLAYYAQCGGGGVQQLAADLTQEINQGGAITSYNDQMVGFLSGTGSYPGAGPIFQANEIGPAIAGMTYPPGTLAADGSVINPNASSAIAT